MIDLCVVSYNTKDKLERLVEGLRSTAKDYGENPPWHLWIADNGSTDDSLAMLEKYGHDHSQWNHRLLYNTVVVANSNIGYARACNQLAALGRAPIIGLLNADVWLSTDDVLAIAKVFSEHSYVDILGPKQRDEAGNITHAGIFDTLEQPRHRGWKFSDPDDVMFRDVTPAVTVAGSAYFIRRKSWDLLANCETYASFARTLRTEADITHPQPLGAFLPTPHYYEETACSYHAHAHGLGVYYWGPISIGHSWHASHDVGSPQDQLFRVSQSMFRSFCDKHNIPHD